MSNVSWSPIDRIQVLVSKASESVVMVDRISLERGATDVVPRKLLSFTASRTLRKSECDVSVSDVSAGLSPILVHKLGGCDWWSWTLPSLAAVWSLIRSRRHGRVLLYDGLLQVGIRLSRSLSVLNRILKKT